AVLIGTGSLRLRIAAERRRYATVTALGAVGMIAVCAGVVAGVAERRPAPRRALSSAQLRVAAWSAAERFLSRYETPTGQVIRLDQGGDTVSEGQAYAMQIS